jgi:hypothetical protein
MGELLKSQWLNDDSGNFKRSRTFADLRIFIEMLQLKLSSDESVFGL